MITPVALLWMAGEDGSGLLGMVIEVVTGWLHAVIGMVWSERGADLWVRVVPVSMCPPCFRNTRNCASL